MVRGIFTVLSSVITGLFCEHVELLKVFSFFISLLNAFTASKETQVLFYTGLVFDNIKMDSLQ